MSDFDALFLEHQKKVTDKLPNVKHVDLWSEQVSFLMEEHPFKAPAIFFAYRILKADDIGDKTQKLNVGVDIYYYYETFADTHRNSKKQTKGLSFLKELTNIHKQFHSSSGDTYSNMRRIGLSPVETGTANLLYVQKFTCTVIDDSAADILEQTEVNNISITNEKVVQPIAPDDVEVYPEIELH